MAAGEGKRLRPLTDDTPKCMVKLLGKSLLERQIATYHSCGVDEPRQLQRIHARIVREDGFSVSLSDIFPDQKPLPEYK